MTQRWISWFEKKFSHLSKEDILKRKIEVKSTRSQPLGLVAKQQIRKHHRHRLYLADQTTSVAMQYAISHFFVVDFPPFFFVIELFRSINSTHWNAIGIFLSDLVPLGSALFEWMLLLVLEFHIFNLRVTFSTLDFRSTSEFFLRCLKWLWWRSLAHPLVKWLAPLVWIPFHRWSWAFGLAETIFKFQKAVYHSLEWKSWNCDEWTHQSIVRLMLEQLYPASSCHSVTENASHPQWSQIASLQFKSSFSPYRRHDRRRCVD